MEEDKVIIRAFIGRFFRKPEIKDDDDIFALGFVNSLFAMQLVMYLEKEFQLTIDNTDLNLDNFRTIDAICSFIERKAV